MSAPEHPSATEAGVRRTVRIGSMPYRDPHGVRRRADAGTVVEVHPDDVDRFDRLNVLAGEVRERDSRGDLAVRYIPDPGPGQPLSPSPSTDPVDTRAAVLDDREATLDAREAELGQKAADLDTRAAVLDDREAALDAREAERDTRVSALDEKAAGPKKPAARASAKAKPAADIGG